MPHFRIETNISKDKVPPNFGKESTALIAKILGKPENYCVATIVPDQLITWGGSNEPAAVASLMSIGKLGVAENKKHAAALYDHVEKNLGIPKTRMYITFTDSPTSVVGYNGTTFHEIFGG